MESSIIFYFLNSTETNQEKIKLSFVFTLENNMENVAFALLKQRLHFP